MMCLGVDVGVLNFKYYYRKGSGCGAIRLATYVTLALDGGPSPEQVRFRAK